jgi:hypothetical protein
MELTPALRATIEKALQNYRRMLKNRIDEPLVTGSERTRLSQEIKDTDTALEQLAQLPTDSTGGSDADR